MTQNSWNSTVPIPVSNGGSGSATLTGVLTGNGTSAFTGSAVTDNTVVMGSTSNLLQDTTITVTDAGEMVNASQPAFGGFPPTADLDVTGNGTTYTVGSGVDFTERFDQGGDFNVNATFTAPVTGRYLIIGALHMVRTSMGSATILTYNIVTSNRTYSSINENSAGDEPLPQVQSSAFADMDASDTATLTVNVNGIGADTADIGGSGSASTYMSGELVC